MKAFFCAIATLLFTAVAAPAFAQGLPQSIQGAMSSRPTTYIAYDLRGNFTRRSGFGTGIYSVVLRDSQGAIATTCEGELSVFRNSASFAIRACLFASGTPNPTQCRGDFNIFAGIASGNMYCNYNNAGDDHYYVTFRLDGR